jgi:serine/threonine protein phosphatase 1
VPDRGNEIYAVLERPRRIWAVAAIHGEVPRLGALHAALSDRFRRGDRIVYLGNHLGRGSAVAAAVDELVRFRSVLLTVPGAEPWDIVYLRGAQEEMWDKLLQLQFAPNPAEVLAWMLEQGIEGTLQAYGSDAATARRYSRAGAMALARWTGELRQAMRARGGHDALMWSLRRYAVTDDGGLLFVHAGVDPTRPLSEQTDTFWWGSGYLDALAEPYQGFHRIVIGYDRRHRGVRIEAFIACADAGCGFGGRLSAICFAPDGAIADRIEV